MEYLHSANDTIYRTLSLLGRSKGYIGNFKSYSTNRYQLDESDTFYRTVNRRNIPLLGEDWELSISNLGLDYSFNSTLPYGFYDQGQWQGRGSNLRLDAGLLLEWKGLSVTLEGTLWMAQNQNFELVPVYGTQEAYEYWYYGGGTIDYFQQPTGSTVLGYSLGQSGIRYSGRFWTVGLTTENIWLGPARFFPIMLSDQAAGFPHIDFGTLGFTPIEIRGHELGLVEGRFYLGYTRESEYFDNDPLNDFNQIMGITAGYAFPFQENLRFGFHYLRRKNMYDFPSYFWQLFDPSDGGPTSTHNDKIDSLFSISANWVFPEAGLEVYGEYARNDYSPNLQVYFTRLDHSNGYTLGLEKIFELNSQKLLSLNFEFSDLMQIPYANRAAQPIWYKHFDVPQGHTNDGQLLGNPIGPGSDSQIVKVSLTGQDVLWEWWMQRIFIDKDYFYTLTVDDGYSHDKNYAQGIFGVKRTSMGTKIDWYSSIEMSANFNYAYVVDNNIVNVSLHTGVSY